MKLNFCVNDEFIAGIQRLSDVLGYKISDDGISVSAEMGDRIGVTLKDNKAIIYYRTKVHFYRELGVLIENAKKSDCFDISEDGFFNTVGTMLDVSRGAAPKLETIFTLIDYLAVMGYNMAMLYSEDMIELDGLPYFGYMRGRYCASDFRAIDDYAYEYGIEVIPCIECYGHMEQYLQWPEAYPIKDTDRVLLAREEKTFQFLDKLISTVSSCFRSKKIHIGMDEAWDMGRGKFLDKNGYVPAFQLFNEYLDRMMEIIDRYGLEPMMWSDMYFRVENENHGYYEESTEISEQTKKSIPKNMTLVFWHYGEKHECDLYMLKKHTELDRRVMFAGGLWSWIGHFPEHNYAYETTKFSLDACRKTGVREMMATAWFNDNAECDVFANLFGLSFSAELAYDMNPTKEKLRARFDACTGGDFDAFYTMSLYHNRFDGENFESYSRRFLGKHLFWQDILEGLYDTHLFDRPMSGHYRECAQKMRTFDNERWNYLYRFAECVFDYLSVKCEIAEKLYPAYSSSDRENLVDISERLLPSLKQKAATVHNAHRDIWHKNLKNLGWANLDVRYGGVESRCDTSKMLLDAYLREEEPNIDSLEQKRLYKELSGFQAYKRIVSASKDGI